MNSKALFLRNMLLMALCLLSLSPASVLGQSTHSKGEWFRYEDTAMTTRISLEFWHQNAKEADAISARVFAHFHAVDRRMSRYRPDSELSMVNARATKTPQVLSPELFDVLLKAQEISRLSKGAFDISFASVGYLYDFRAGRAPGKAALNTLKTAIDYRNIVLDPQARTVALHGEDMVLDLGGIAKGYAVDLGVQTLREAGVAHARLSAGGDMRLLGDKRGKPWIVGVKDPRVDDAKAVVLPLSELAISTSGDYERFFLNEAGERVHHILSPQTGRPVQGIQSVTVLGVNAIETDALSTAVFVLGVKKGLELINSLPGLDVIILDDQRILHYSDDLMPPE